MGALEAKAHAPAVTPAPSSDRRRARWVKTTWPRAENGASNAREEPPTFLVAIDRRSASSSPSGVTV